MAGYEAPPGSWSWIGAMDVSGSMVGSKIDILIQAVHAMSYALTLAGAQVFGISFNAEILDVPYETLFKMKELSVLLKKRLKEMGGCNRDGAAVKRAADMMMKYPQSPAKIIVVFSDGSPNCGACHAPKGSIELKLGQSEYLVRQIREARNRQLEVLAVDIQSGAATHYYGEAKTAQVKNLGQLYQQAMQLLERNIRRG